MSYVEHPRDWTEQERLKWIKTYQGVVEPTNSWIPEYTIDYKKKCCDNCEYFGTPSSGDGDGFCLKNVANDKYREYIIYSDTFYCSYHKFRD